MSKKLRIIPLGGLGEIGKNMTMLEYGRNQIIVDCGVMFPEGEMHGIDLVLPRFDYVIQNQDSLRGILLTHGHQDHIGGLPYLLEQVKAPIYGTSLAIGMVRRRLEESGLPLSLNGRDLLNVLDDQRPLHLGPFRITPFAVAHSIPASVGFVIDTPVGAVVHTGDYKLDETPSGGRTTDLERLRQLTPGGTLVMLGDSTNADRPGRTPTEQLVADTLDRIFRQAADSRIIVATFSSVLARIQEIMRLAAEHGRKVALTGRSMIQNVELARELGYLHVPADLLVDIASPTPDGQLVILSTGSQGEPRSALNRMAQGEHRQIQVHDGDTIIVSAGTIPGNEEDVNRMLNRLFARGAHVIYGPMATVHVSGHGSREDMSIMLDHVRPRFLIPVHGELRHLHLHARLAQEQGHDASHTFILENGACWATDGEKAWLEDPVPAGDVYVDGSMVGDSGAGFMEERKRLSEDGLVVAYVPLNRRRKLAGEPQVIGRGLMATAAYEELMTAAKAELKRELKRNGRSANGDHNKAIREALGDFFYKNTRSRPLILPTIINVS